MTSYAALVRMLRSDASGDPLFMASSDKKTLQAAADAIEALAGEADRHGAEAFGLARDLREARNELARLNGQTFEIVDKAAIWDEGYRAGWNDYQFRTTARNPYRKADE